MTNLGSRVRAERIPQVKLTVSRVTKLTVTGCHDHPRVGEHAEDKEYVPW
jgi:hypothetical protein